MQVQLSRKVDLSDVRGTCLWTAHSRVEWHWEQSIETKIMVTNGNNDFNSKLDKAEEKLM